MARGFGSTLGVGTTDIITTALTSRSTQRSYHLWMYINGAGGGGFGRTFDSAGSLSAFPSLGGGIMQYAREWSGGNATWNTNIAYPTTQWVSAGISYDGGSTTNDPVLYQNGSVKSITESAAPSGTLTTTTGAYSLGNRASDSGRNWDGMLAEFAVWDGILTAADFASLAKGRSAREIRPDILVHYEPMVRANHSPLSGVSTITGTAVKDHPRVILPKPMRWKRSYVAPTPAAQILVSSSGLVW